MIESLHIAATGMESQQTNLDVVANNLANINTTGFKKSRVNFEDLMYRELVANQSLQNGSNKTLGLGAAVTKTEKIFSAGDLKQTNRDLDLAIRGKGLFEVLLPDGSTVYSRTGSFQVNQDGMIVNGDGNPLSGLVQIPKDAEQLVIQSDGLVLAKVPGEEELIEVGQIELANFVNHAGLKAIGSNMYATTEESGDAIMVKPGEDGVGQIAQGFLESSNVKLVEELTNMILAQRAYEINSKVIQASDDILGIINNMRR